MLLSQLSFSDAIWLSVVTIAFMWIIVLLNLVRRLFTNHGLPANLPWAGTGTSSGPLARARANLTSFFQLKSLLTEGYNEHSKVDRAYVLPYFLNGPEVILPVSQSAWLTSQPNTILCQDKVNRQFLQAEHVFAHATLVKDPVHPEVIQQQLTRKLSKFIPGIVQEMEQSLKDNWGTEEGAWREVGMYDTLLDIVTRLSLRVFMGEQYCRDPDLIKATQTFNRKVALPAAAISMFPEFLKPFVAPLFTAYDYVQYLRCRRIILPILRSRLQKLRRGQLPFSDAKTPNDYLQWAINHAISKSTIDPLELDERVITSRFAVLCFAAIQSSVITLTNTIFDIIASPDRDMIMDTLRNDVLQAVSDPGNNGTGMVWTKPSIANMKRVDSALRESMRLNGFIQRGILKMVVAPEGVTLPDGSHLPCGAKVGISQYSVHRDEDYYKDANTYKAFRFALALTDKHDDFNNTSPLGTEQQQQEQHEQKSARCPPQALVNTSETFMGFSHGEHACPGRFFAANQLKIALAHIALHYDLEPVLAEGQSTTSFTRPENKWFFGHMAPPLHEKVRVRRRRTAVE